MSFGFLHKVTASSRSPMECVNVSRVASTPPVVQQWQRGAEIDLLVNGASPGLTRYGLDVVPPTNGSWWDLLKDIASSTLSYMGFDEDGLFHFRRYEYITPGDATSPVLTLTAQRDIADITVDEEAAAIRNRIEVGLVSWTRAQTLSEVLVYGSVTQIAAGASVSIHFDFGVTRPWRMRTPMMYTGAAPPANATVAKFLTSTGALAPVECEMHWVGDWPVVTYHNRGTGAAYVATDSSLSAGSLRFAFADNSSETLRPVVREDADSIARYGQQALEVPTSDWVQNAFFADNLALALLTWTAWPVPLTSPVTILPDPRLQTGDVVLIQDPTGSMIDGTFRVLGYTVRGDGSDVEMTVDVRPLYRPRRPVDADAAVEPILDPDLPTEPG
jgi:hypothetical protein